MPDPRPREPEAAYVQRCIPVVLHEKTAKNGAQAAAICHSMFRKRKEARAAYDDSQPRVPAGSEEGGEWTSGHAAAQPEREYKARFKNPDLKRVDRLINAPAVLKHLKIPPVMYHVTSQENAERILREGLRPGAADSTKDGENLGVYLSPDPTGLSEQGVHIEGEPVVLAVRTEGLSLRLDPEYFYYGDESRASVLSWIDTISGRNEEGELWAVYSRRKIPPSAISVEENLRFGSAARSAFSEDQPRVPAGDPEGGQWTNSQPGGQVTSGDQSPWDLYMSGEPTRTIDGQEYTDFSVAEKDFPDSLTEEQLAAWAFQTREFIDERLGGADWAEGLTAQQRAAMQEYLQEMAYDQINGYLRTGELKRNADIAEPALKGIIRNMDSAIAANTLGGNLVVYRGMLDEEGTFDPGGKIRAGATFRDKGYTSVSVNEFIAEGYAGDTGGVSEKRRAVLMEIHLPAGTHAAPLESIKDKGMEAWAYNQELVLPRGMSFRVVSTHYGARSVRVVLEPAPSRRRAR